MFGALPSGWKLGLTGALVVAILGSLALRAPRDPIDRVELRRLVFAALALYGVGAAAALTGRASLAGVVYASGIIVCSLAVWLSRGFSRGDGPGGGGVEDPRLDQGPPGGPDPADLPQLDWDEFERERARWGSGREPVSG